MAKITLKRFKDVAAYTENKTGGTIKDGDLFIINETRQIGTNCKGNYILTPSNTLNDYIPVEGELFITGHDSISRAIAKLEYRVGLVKNLANSALNAVANLEELENVTDTEAALVVKISELEAKLEGLPKHVCLSETAYNTLDEIDQNTVYYIYEND